MMINIVVLTSFLLLCIFIYSFHCPGPCRRLQNVRFIKATFELKTKLPGSNDRFHSGSGVQELKRNVIDIKKVINSSKSRSSAMFTNLLKMKRKTNKTKKATTKEKYSA